MLSASMAASSDSFVSVWAAHRVMAWSASASSTSRAGEPGVQRCHLVEPESSFLLLGVAAGDEVFQIGAQLFRHGLIACAGEVGPAEVGVAARQHREGDALERAQQRDLCFAGGRAVLDLPQVERRVAPGRNHLRTATGAEDPAEG